MDLNVSEICPVPRNYSACRMALSHNDSPKRALPSQYRTRERQHALEVHLGGNAWSLSYHEESGPDSFSEISVLEAGNYSYDHEYNQQETQVETISREMDCQYDAALPVFHMQGIQWRRASSSSGEPAAYHRNFSNCLPPRVGNSYGGISDASESSARLRWRQALDSVRAEAAERVAMRRKPPTLFKLYRGLVVLVLAELAIAAFLAGINTAIEGDEFYELYGIIFNGQGSLSQPTANFLAGIYMQSVIATRIGFGDVLPCTVAGKGLVIGTHVFISFPVNIQMQIQLYRFLDGALQRLRKGLGLQHVRLFKEVMAGMLFVLFLGLMSVAWMIVSRLGEAERPWTFLDALWYVWQTSCAVGYGDMTHLSIQLSNMFPAMLLGKLTYIFGYGLLNSLLISALSSTWHSREFSPAKMKQQRLRPALSKGLGWRLRSEL
eukprot:scaffold93546_cov32-Prasinocladus_malaysianus.AAC.1